jgi:hypothetical protein
MDEKAIADLAREALEDAFRPVPLTRKEAAERGLMNLVRNNVNRVPAEDHAAWLTYLREFCRETALTDQFPDIAAAVMRCQNGTNRIIEARASRKNTDKETVINRAATEWTRDSREAEFLYEEKGSSSIERWTPQGCYLSDGRYIERLSLRERHRPLTMEHSRWHGSFPRVPEVSE